MAKSIKWTNENGNVSVKVRDGIRKQLIAKALEVMADGFDGAVANANGGISIPVGMDERSGEMIFAHFDMVVNMKSPDVKTEKKKTKKKAVEETEIPDLFGENN